ncbi:DUF2846 domain-containing protein [bacterium]|nr:DUF2846 domain-containing protein [bacterium]
MGVFMINCVLMVCSLFLVASCASNPVASKADDAIAKSFNVPSDKSVVYVYRERSASALMMSMRMLNLNLDGRYNRALDNSTFHRFELKPGEHFCVAQVTYDSGTIAGALPGELEFNTEAGEIYFIEVKERWETPLNNGIAIKLQSEVTGKSEISSRTLARRR